MFGRSTATVKFYLSDDGSDTNSGEMPSSPIKTVGKALQLASTISHSTAGAIEFYCAPGEYTYANATLPLNCAVGTTISFIGHVEDGVPDVFFEGVSGGGRSSGSAMRVSFGAVVSLTDIFIRNYSTAVAAAQTGRITMHNVHIRNCIVGASAGNGGYITAVGGDWDGRDMADVVIPNSIGHRAVIGCPFNLEQSGPDPETPDVWPGLKIHHFERGSVLSEGSSGHMDYMQYEDCAIGIETTRGAGTPNTIPIRMRRCAIPFLTRDTAPLLLADVLDFAYGTADACGPVIASNAGYSGSVDSTNYDTRLKRQIRSAESTSNLTGSTTESNLWQVCKLMPGRVRNRDRMTTELFGLCSGGLSSPMTLRFKFGSTTVATITLPTGTGRWQVKADFHFIGETVSSIVKTKKLRGQISYVADADAFTSAVQRLTNIAIVECISETDPTQYTITKQAGSSSDNISLSSAFCDATVTGVSV